MRRRRHFRSDIGVMIFAALGVGLAWGQAQSRTPWLDKPVQNWNDPRVGIPKAPSRSGDSNPICDHQPRFSPTSPEERKVSAIGWKLDGPTQKTGQTALVAAESDVDGMCRPLGYQYFVFVNGEFVGTISPVPMDSRTDGAARSVRLNSESEVIAEFERYSPTDPLCCASRVSRVSFIIDRRNGAPTLVPQAIRTMPRS